ncbi:MAG: hypothetical protein LUE17_14575 [Planctomycetaceae bacterium]|nr:hypothetical protein [Planctomycetaceae bacterium]
MAHKPKGRLMPVVLLLVDIAALAWFWHALVRFRRPLDVLLILLAVLGILTALAGGRILRSVALMVISLSMCLLAVEMGQKYFDFLSLGPRHSVIHGAGGPYAWDSNDALSYVDSKRRAEAAGDYGPPLGERFAGDIFAGRDIGYRVTGSGANRRTVVEALHNPYVTSSPTTLEFAPDNEIRHHAFIDGGDTLFDAHITINPYGFRHTPGNGAAGETVIFLGCSQTFGYGLSDDETAAAAYAQAGGHSQRVLNISVANTGPHQALRELELQHCIGRAGVRPEQVRGVVYTFIDDHPNRVVHPNNAQAPYYRLKGTLPVYEGTFADSSHFGRTGVLLGRSRVYPTLADWLSRRGGVDSYKWRLTYAILARMDDLCRQRYGVGLTIVYWDETPEVLDRLRGLGLTTLRVSDALGENWRDMAIRYLLYDGHASAYANRLIGRMVHTELNRDGNGDRP